MRQIDETKPLSAEDRQWLTDWGRFDTIARIDEANGKSDSQPEETVPRSDLVSLLASVGVEVGDDDDVVDAVRGLLSGTNTAPVEDVRAHGDSAAHVAPDPAEVAEAPSGSDALGTPDGDGTEDPDGDWYEDDDTTNEDLRDELGRRELSKSGNKHELIARLRESDAAGYEA